MPPWRKTVSASSSRPIRLFSAMPDLAGVRLGQSSQDVEQGALPRARRAHDRDEAAVAMVRSMVSKAVTGTPPWSRSWSPSLRVAASVIGCSCPRPAHGSPHLLTPWAIARRKLGVGERMVNRGGAEARRAKSGGFRRDAETPGREMRPSQSRWLCWSISRRRWSELFLVSETAAWGWRDWNARVVHPRWFTTTVIDDLEPGAVLGHCDFVNDGDIRPRCRRMGRRASRSDRLGSGNHWYGGVPRRAGCRRKPGPSVVTRRGHLRSQGS